jgi:hypothetical protein
MRRSCNSCDTQAVFLSRVREELQGAKIIGEQYDIPHSERWVQISVERLIGMIDALRMVEELQHCGKDVQLPVAKWPPPKMRDE